MQYNETLQFKNSQLEKAKSHAQSKGGECLSNKCLNSKSKLEWKCSNPNHPSWFAKYTNVVNNGNWCKKCNIENIFPKEKYLQLAKEHAIAKGGLCLSIEYLNNYTKMKWKCENKNHKIWEAGYSSIINNGNWCPECGILESAKNKVLKDGLAKAQEYAKNKGGKCLSKIYVLGRYNLEWKCHNNKHKSWFNSYTQVISSGSWCPECGEEKNVQEFRVRKILNYLFKTEFIKTKKENCIRNNIKLLIINEFRKNKNCKTFFENILNAITNNKIEIPPYEYSEIKKLYTLSPQNNHQELYYKTCIEYAKSRNGYCLSKEYINNSEKMEWKCANKAHTSWYSDYNHIIARKSWCPQCAIEERSQNQRNKNGLNEAKKYAITKDGQCISNEYINAKNLLEWKCKNPEHPSWLSSYNNMVIKKRWCALCKSTTINLDSKTYSNKRNQLEKAKLYAQSKNGICLSQQYTNTKTKLEWKCKNPTHAVFNKSFEHVVVRNQWCTECKKNTV